MSLTRRIYTWLFGEPDFENNYSLSKERESVIGYLVKALAMLFKGNFNNQEEIIKPIKILQNFFMKHNHFIPLTLKPISANLLNYIQVHLNNTEIDKEIRANLRKTCLRFMSSIASYYYLMIGKPSINA